MQRQFKNDTKVIVTVQNPSRTGVGGWWAYYEDELGYEIRSHAYMGPFPGFVARFFAKRTGKRTARRYTYRIGGEG